LIGIIEYWGTGTASTILIIVEVKCGMIGFGVIIGIHLIDGHHLDMTDGVIITTDTE